MHSRTLTAFIILLGFITVISATDIYLPSLPGMATYFNSTASVLQSSIAIFLIAQFGGAPFWGLLSDHVSHKATLSFGLALFLLGAILAACATNVSWFLGARFLQGLGAIAIPIVGWASISQLYPKEKAAQIMSLMGGIMTMVPLIAPMIGGQVDTHFGWRANFVILSLVAFVPLVLLSFLPLTKSESSPKKISLPHAFNSYKVVLSNRGFLGYVLVFALLCSGEFTYFTIAPFYLEEALGLSAEQIGYFIALVACAFMIGSFCVSKIMARIGNNKTIYLGIGLCFAAALVLFFMHFVCGPSLLIFAIAAAIFLFGLSITWTLSILLALQQVPFAHRGKASASRSIINTALQAAGSTAGQIFFNHTILPMALYFVAVSFCALFAFKFAHSNEIKENDMVKLY